jgi:predicted GNAT superfamily acetyltransferase
MGIFLRKLETLEDLEQMACLEQKVWAMNPVPLHQTLTVAKNGGVLIGAFDDNRMVGFVYSFPGFLKGETYLCSHMMGIDPAYQNQGLGYRSKMKQAEEAKQLGYSKIRWTYDPLESRNGYLNIAKLGAICSDYIENCYGEMNDELNKGLPSDRFNVEWLIDSPYLEQRHQLFNELPVQKEALLLEWELRGNGQPHAINKDGAFNKQTNIQYLFVPVPLQFQQIKQTDKELAFDWRFKTREVLTEAFAEGWAVVQVIRNASEPVQYYVLVKRETLNVSQQK